MKNKINGIHHITAIAGDPQKNYSFYTKILGMRFVKKTVNFDAPDVYHFYFADELGTPGTVLTFFPFPNAKRGVRGIGEAITVSFSVSKGALDFWIGWLSQNGINFNGPEYKFGFKFISIFDPDGMKLELVEDDVDHLVGWETKDINRQDSIKKIFGTTLFLGSSKSTVNLLSNLFGFTFQSEEKGIERFITGHGDNEASIDIKTSSDVKKYIQSAGSIHHIAWRTESDQSQIEWLNKLRSEGFYPTDVIDRNYFHSIYFREPGGILFEIATDNPGFMIDEDQNELGKKLMLPKIYEPRREEIEKVLIPLN